MNVQSFINLASKFPSLGTWRLEKLIQFIQAAQVARPTIEISLVDSSKAPDILPISIQHPPSAYNTFSLNLLEKIWTSHGSSGRF
jgi:hypothetical protein